MHSISSNAGRSAGLETEAQRRLQGPAGQELAQGMETPPCVPKLSQLERFCPNVGTVSTLAHTTGKRVQSRLTSPSALPNGHFLACLPPLMVYEPTEGLCSGPVCIARITRSRTARNECEKGNDEEEKAILVKRQRSHFV